MYYSYSDSQGSLIALDHDGGSVIQRFAYDPWGARRDPNNWTVKDSRTSFIINRGYTGHEHLDAFGIINMNGRVYDPLTAQFFSPDPYVQAPGEWLNYNRYTYCSGNPFRYTDPSGNLQIGPFYISLNIGWSANGGLSFGISAGVGLENLASVGISIGFGAKYGNFSISINVGLGGAYAYAGYDTKGGWIGGAGIAAPSAFSMWSPVSINTNLSGIAIDYSENGGLSGNFLGASFSGSGVSFNPSVGASLEFRYGSGRNAYEIENSNTADGQNFQFDSDYLLNEFIAKYVNKDDYNIEELTAYGDDFDNHKDYNTYRDKRGWIKEYKNDGTEKTLGGVTYLKYRGLKTYSDIYLSRNPDRVGLIKTINHELTHAYINSQGYSRTMDKKTFNRFSESSAYSISNGNIPEKFYNGNFPLVRPPHLIPIPNF